MLAFHGLVALFALYMLAKHGPRGLLLLAPSLVRARPLPGGPGSPAQLRAAEVLEGLGFVRVGARLERSPLAGLDLPTDCWAHPEGSYADVFPAAGREPPAYFLATFRDGTQLLTANFRRTPVSGKDGQIGGLADLTLEAAWAAHRQALARLASTHGPPAAPADLPARGEIARRFYRGIGARELRRAALVPFLNAAVALLLLASSVNLALHLLKR